MKVINHADFFIDTKSKFDSFTKFRIATNNDNDRVELDSLLLDLNKKIIQYHK